MGATEPTMGSGSAVSRASLFPARHTHPRSLDRRDAKATRAAFCFAGQPRTFVEPLVLEGISANAIEAFGANAVAFYYLTDDDAGSSWNHPALSHTRRTVHQATGP